jgi:hypothetical protein
MKITARDILIGIAIVVAVGALLDPIFSARILGSIQSISITILAWVAIIYLLKKMKD